MVILWFLVRSMSRHPYAGLPDERFWNRAVAGRTREDLTLLYKKRFSIGPTQRIASAGSCFAQHITTHMRDRGYRILDMEPPPQGMSKRRFHEFGYRLYSARYGNIYTARHLLQLAKEALGRWTPADGVWERDGAYFDAMRPTVEPRGLESSEEVFAHRREHLKQVRSVLRHADVFVFTFGLTEAWEHQASGTVYPVAPGVVAGSFDPAVYRFINLSAGSVFDDFSSFREIVKEINPECKFLVSVSPVPLIATASHHHVLRATMSSKSALRTAAEMLFETFEDVDYFPSYELISSPYFTTPFSEDMRSVSPIAVDAAMAMFFEQHQAPVAPSKKRSRQDTVCDENLIKAFT